MAAFVGGLAAAARQRTRGDEAPDDEDDEGARDPSEIFVDERLDRCPEQAEQQAYQHEGKGPAREACPQEGDEVHVDEAGGDRKQLEGNRRRALHQDDLGAIVAQIAGSGRKALGQMEHAEQPQPDAFVQEEANPIAEHPARDRRERADQRIAHGLFRFGEAHQPQHRMRRDRKEARLDERHQPQPIFGVRMRRFLHRPAIKALDHRLVARDGGHAGPC